MASNFEIDMCGTKALRMIMSMSHCSELQKFNDPTFDYSVSPDRNGNDDDYDNKNTK